MRAEGGTPATDTQNSRYRRWRCRLMLEVVESDHERQRRRHFKAITIVRSRRRFRGTERSLVPDAMRRFADQASLCEIDDSAVKAQPKLGEARPTRCPYPPEGSRIEVVLLNH